MQNNQKSPLMRVSSVLEVMGIYASGLLVSYLICRLTGMVLANPLTRLSAETTPKELLFLTGKLVQLLLVQTAGWFLLILPLGWWFARRNRRGYGVTLNHQSMGALVIIGLILFASSDLTEKALSLLNLYVPLGDSAAWKAALFQLNWKTGEFWLFTAVGSYGLVPVLEELFYRGYCQTRLKEGLGAPTAILATALLFTLSHGQYYIMNGFNIGMLLCIFISSAAYGYVFEKTGSLVPSIVAHALINIPVAPGLYLWIEFAAMVAVCIIARKQIYRYIVEIPLLLPGRLPVFTSIFVLLVFGTFAVLFNLAQDIMILVGIVFFVAALVLNVIEHKAKNNHKDEALLKL